MLFIIRHCLFVFLLFLRRGVVFGFVQIGLVKGDGRLVHFNADIMGNLNGERVILDIRDFTVPIEVWVRCAISS